jgi:hypothetical protein
VEHASEFEEDLAKWVSSKTSKRYIQLARRLVGAGLCRNGLSVGTVLVLILVLVLPVNDLMKTLLDGEERASASFNEGVKCVSEVGEPGAAQVT